MIHRLALGTCTLLALASLACGPPTGASSASHSPATPTGEGEVSIEVPGEGPVEVRSLELTWVDDTRRDTASRDHDDRRAIMVSVRYPSRDGGATVAAPNGPLPVILFSPGYCLNAADYTAIIDPLVARGHVVIAIDHPFVSGSVRYPDGRVVTCNLFLADDLVISLLGGDLVQAADRTLALAQVDPARFAGKLDGSRIGILGHSIGAGAGVDVFLRERRFHALVMLDGDATGSSTHPPDSRPILYQLAGGHTLAADASLTRVWSERSGPRFAVHVASAGHMSYAGTTPSPFIELIVAYDQAFFDAAFGVASYDVLLGLPAAHPEGTLEHAGLGR